MAQKEATTARVDLQGDDNVVDLAEQYRTERRVGSEGEPVGRPRSFTMIMAAQPISQVEPDHWDTKADKSTVTAEKLVGIREKYQIPAEIELKLPTTKERPSDA